MIRKNMKDRDKNKEISYCPFCGNLSMTHHGTYLECNLCFATGPKILNKDIDYNIIHNAAIAIWNNRYEPIRVVVE